MAVEAAERVKRRRPPGASMVPGQVVAELGFGFWVGLFAKAYDERLWRTHLYRRFHPRPARHDVFDVLDRLRTLRNRIAHHEPVFQRNLVDDAKRVDRLLTWLSAPVAAWVRHHSRAFDVVALAPHEVETF